MKIKPVDKDIQTLLSSGFYVIPRFQRPYSWEAENIMDFWNDTCVQNSEDYFIGSMVVFPDAEGGSTFYVVDGQQRLTTITILLCMLRNVFQGLEEDDLAKGVQGLIERKDINNKSKYVLYAESSYPYLHDHIQKMGHPDSNPTIGEEERAIELAARLFRKNIDEKLKGLTKVNSISWLKELRDRLLNLKVISIELDNEDDAYLIFETLNTRGKDLEISDLLKNLLTKNLKVKNSQNDTVKEKWKQLGRIANGLSSDVDLNSFIHHHWLSSKEYIAENKLFKSLKANIKSKEEANTYLSQLTKEVAYYRAIFSPSEHRFSGQEKALQQSLSALQIFRVRQPVPMMLSSLSAYYSKEITKSQIEVFLKKLENFHFLFTAITSQRSSGGISQMYSKSARDLRGANDKNAKQQVIKDLLTKLKDRAPELESFELGFAEVRFSDVFPRQKPLTRYILQKMHEHLSNHEPVDYSQYSIEHIEPQSSKKLSEDNIASLGNLILVPANLNSNKLQNKGFSEKRRLLLEANQPLDDTLSTATTWGAREIKTRQDNFARLAYKSIWNL